MEIFLVHCIRLVLLDPWPGFVGDQCEEKCGKEDMKVVRRATKINKYRTKMFLEDLVVRVEVWT